MAKKPKPRAAKLLPCPCCGSSGLLVGPESAWDDSVLCRSCGLKIIVSHTWIWDQPKLVHIDEAECRARCQREAVRRWNTRPKQGRPLVEVLKEPETRYKPGSLGAILEREKMVELPPIEFSNAMHKIGRPVGTDYRSTPEWKIWLAARRFENRRMRDELKAADEVIERLEREIEGD
jgi:hypothetical protein